MERPSIPSSPNSCSRDPFGKPLITRDRGSVTAYASIFIVVLMLFIGLAVDGGAKLRAGWEAVGAAEEAARAGAGQIDRTAAYHGRGFSVDRSAAVRATRSYLEAGGHRGTVTITGAQAITVTVHVTKPTWLLSIVGMPSVTASATATANLVPGIEGPGR